MSIVGEHYVRRRLPVGAEVQADGGTHFRVWAPKRQRVEVVLADNRGTFELPSESRGYFSGFAMGVGDGDRYWLRLDRDKDLLPDLASRYQPEGPEGPSEVVDPRRYTWHDQDWKGCKLRGQVLYEMHVGTFTREGSWQAAAKELAELAEAGISLIELLPVAVWMGDFGWGYDGVNLFAPTRLYGRPDDFRSFVDEAHRRKIGVVLDVVYNHLGIWGNHAKEFSDHFFSKRHETEWGEAVNFDEKGCHGVREFFLANTRYWIEEFHLDGFRIDATQSIYDSSASHILTELVAEARSAAEPRDVIAIAENEPQNTLMIRSLEEGGHGMDATWNDDFHHVARVRVTGRREAYYRDYLGRSSEFLAMLKYGFLYQGQWYGWQGKGRGKPTFGLPGEAFVNYLQNHDQVANSADGRRLHELTSPGRYRAITALLLLGPQTPLLFQGQEFAASSPFRYFASGTPELDAQIEAGRRKFLSQFRSLATEQMQERLPQPGSRSNFEVCKLDFSQRVSHRQQYALHKDLIRLRRTDPVLSQQRADRLDGEAISDDFFIVRLFGPDGSDRLLVFNFGREQELEAVPYPLLAPAELGEWRMLWSSEDPAYGGTGTAAIVEGGRWHLPAEIAVVLAAPDA